MSALAATWNRFWFEPRATSTLALVRIAVGLVCVGWTASLAPDVSTFFGPDGLQPDAPSVRWWFDLLSVADSSTATWVLWSALLAASAAMTVGWRTRAATVVVFVALLSFQHRNPYVLNSGDLLVRHLVLFLALSPAGAAVSLDRRRVARRRGEDPWACPERVQWGLRLLQVQLSVLYLASVWAKLPGRTWNDGTAISYALRLEDLDRFPFPDVLLDSVLVVNLLTWGALAVELAVGVLVWNRRARPWALGAGVLLHVGIDLTIMVGFFSYALFAAYLAFVPPEVATRWIHRAVGLVRGTPAPDPGVPPAGAAAADAPADGFVAPPA